MEGREEAAQELIPAELAEPAGPSELPASPAVEPEAAAAEAVMADDVAAATATEVDDAVEVVAAASSPPVASAEAEAYALQEAAAEVAVDFGSEAATDRVESTRAGASAATGAETAAPDRTAEEPGSADGAVGVAEEAAACRTASDVPPPAPLAVQVEDRAARPCPSVSLVLPPTAAPAAVLADFWGGSSVAVPRALLREILNDGACPLHLRLHLQRLLSSAAEDSHCSESVASGCDGAKVLEPLEPATAAPAWRPSPRLQLEPVMPHVLAELPLAEVLAVRACCSSTLLWSMHYSAPRLGELGKAHDRIRSRLWIERVAWVNRGGADETVFETPVRRLADDALRRRMEAEMDDARHDMEHQIRAFQIEVDRRMEQQAQRVHAIVEERVQQQIDTILAAEMEKVRTMVEERVQGRVRAVVQREVHATVCKMQVRLAMLARENDRLRTAFLEHLDHSDLCFRSLVWALSPNSTGLFARTLRGMWCCRRWFTRACAWMLGVPPDERTESLRARLESLQRPGGEARRPIGGPLGGMSPATAAAVMAAAMASRRLAQSSAATDATRIEAVEDGPRRGNSDGDEDGEDGTAADGSDGGSAEARAPRGNLFDGGSIVGASATAALAAATAEAAADGAEAAAVASGLEFLAPWLLPFASAGAARTARSDSVVMGQPQEEDGGSASSTAGPQRAAAAAIASAAAALVFGSLSGEEEGEAAGVFEEDEAEDYGEEAEAAAAAEAVSAAAPEPQPPAHRCSSEADGDDEEDDPEVGRWGLVAPDESDEDLVPEGTAPDASPAESAEDLVFEDAEDDDREPASAEFHDALEDDVDEDSMEC